jgi:prepilin-type N-terminal cleavage/methylation domain-containing protein
MIFPQQPERKKIQILTSFATGFTLAEFKVAVAIIGILCAVAITSFVRTRTRSQRINKLPASMIWV